VYAANASVCPQCREPNNAPTYLPPANRVWRSTPPPVPEVVVDLNHLHVDPNSEESRLFRIILRKGGESQVVHIILADARSRRPWVTIRGVGEHRDVERRLRASLWNRGE